MLLLECAVSSVHSAIVEIEENLEVEVSWNLRVAKEWSAQWPLLCQMAALSSAPQKGWCGAGGSGSKPQTLMYRAACRAGYRTVSCIPSLMDNTTP